MDKIELFRRLLNSFSNSKWQVISGEVLAETPKYPFIELFVINLSPDFHNQSVEIKKRNEHDLIEENLKTYSATLQLNCRHKTIKETVILANELYRLINYEKRKKIINEGIGIKEMSIIRNLNYEVSGKWSYCYSFDVEISFDVIEEREIETIETIKLNVNKQEVTVNE